MFKNLKDFAAEDAQLEVDAQGVPTTRELHISTAVLLTEIALADSSIAGAELDQIMSALNSTFRLTDSESAHIIEVADFLLRDKGKTEQFVTIIKNRFTEQQLETVAQMMWKVMMADGVVTENETKCADRIGHALGLTPESVMKAIERIS